MCTISLNTGATSKSSVPVDDMKQITYQGLRKIRRQYTEFSCASNVTPGGCAPLRLYVQHECPRVIQKNQLDATITIYWSTRSAQHVSGNLLPIFRSVRLRFLQHMVSCCCGRQGFGERQRGTTCTVPQQQDTICCKNLSLTLLKMGKRLPETCWADLVDQ